MPHFNKKMISFFLTTRCNLCCRYCYNAKERSEIEESTISLEIAKAGIDWYFSNTPYRHIRFYGPGEPTQEFEIMRRITEYAKSYFNGGDRVTAEIQTNGIFTEDVREWLLQNINIIWLSFDGMRDIQNYNRPINPQYSHLYSGKSSAEVLEENALWLNDNKGTRNLMVGARVTITSKNVDKQKEMVDYFYNFGIRHVWTDPLFASVGKKPVIQQSHSNTSYELDMRKYIDEYVSAFDYAQSKGAFWGSFLAVNFDGSSPFHCRCCDPLSAPHLTSDGYISACDMVLLGRAPFHMSPFVVGKWNEKSKKFDLYFEKIKKLNNRCSTKMEHCQECPVQLCCGGYCLGEVTNETGRLDGQIRSKCVAIKDLYSRIGNMAQYPYLHP